jgi:hypothetical protein
MQVSNDILNDYQKEMEKVFNIAQKLDAMNPTLPGAFTGDPSERITRQLIFLGVFPPKE